MGWTAPMTWVTNQVVTAAQLNANIRDNLLETAVAKATTAGTFFSSTGANQLAERLLDGNQVPASETTTSSAATDLATVGPGITVTAGNRALVMLTGSLSNNTAGGTSLMGYEISGATTAGLGTSYALRFMAGAANQLASCSFVSMRPVSAGTNTFTSKYLVSAGTTGTFALRHINVLPF